MNSKTGLQFAVCGGWDYGINVTNFTWRIWFVGLSNFEQLVAPFLLSCTRIFDLSCIQSLATITIITYGVKIKEQQHGSIMDLRLTEMQCDIKYLT